MKKLHPLLSVLFLISVGFGQKLHESIETYESGNIKSITYHKKTGNRIEIVKKERYYQNGQKREEGNYKDGEEHGLWIEWYKNGQKKSEKNYKDGRLINTPKRWYEDGKKMVL